MDGDTKSRLRVVCAEQSNCGAVESADLAREPVRSEHWDGVDRDSAWLCTALALGCSVKLTSDAHL